MEKWKIKVSVKFLIELTKSCLSKTLCSAFKYVLIYCYMHASKQVEYKQVRPLIRQQYLDPFFRLFVEEDIIIQRINKNKSSNTF